VTSNLPKVSICVITYNQQAYIAQCLQSIVDQDTNFEFELIVGDDCSTDGTPAIVRSFVHKYPDVVKAIFQPSNTGGTQNLLNVHDLARGEYIADIDGDDYALPGKLQAQSDCLDQNPDVALAAHALRVIGADRIIGDGPQFPVKGSIQDLLRLGTYFGHSSVMFRRANKLPSSGHMHLVDYYFYMEHAIKGAIFLDRRVFGCYRLQENSLSQNVQNRALIEECYEVAFDRALQLGVSLQVVQSARLSRRMSFAITRLLAGDVEGFKEKIELSGVDFLTASYRHQLLHFLRKAPSLVIAFVRIRRP
jgi:glycosyltransferase involved in cell wall biosynthesis